MCMQKYLLRFDFIKNLITHWWIGKHNHKCDLFSFDTEGKNSAFRKISILHLRISSFRFVSSSWHDDKRKWAVFANWFSPVPERWGYNFCFGQRFFSLFHSLPFSVSQHKQKKAPFVCITWHASAKSHNIVKLTMSILHRFYVRAWANDGVGCDFIVSTELERSLCYTCVNDVNSQNHKKHETVISCWRSFVANIQYGRGGGRCWWLFSSREISLGLMNANCDQMSDRQREERKKPMNQLFLFLRPTDVCVICSSLTADIRIIALSIKRTPHCFENESFG